MSTNPAVNGQFVETLTTGKVKAHPKLAKIIGADTVEFTDGTILSGVDVIIMATGYCQEFLFCKSLWDMN